MGPDTFNMLFAALRDVSAGFGSIFESTGRAIMLPAVILVIMIFGGQTLFNGFDMRRFIKIVVAILLVEMALINYSRPGIFGVSFTGLVKGETDYLSNKLTLASESETIAFSNMTALYQGTERSVSMLPFNKELIRYYFMLFVLSVLEAIVWAVIAWGFIASAMLSIIGPIPLPFAIIPGMEHFFWGWFKSYIQYNFYSVVGGCYMLVAARVLGYLVTRFTPPFSPDTAWRMLLPTVMTAAALAFGVVHIPSLTASLFAGRSGESVVPRFARI